jgi:uncharacterized membrane protein YeaQ/YmgE (transglycosylase-associated protein family)
VNQNVTITFNPQYVITWIIIGLIAGFLASLLIRGRGLGTLGNIIVGLIGAVIGGLIFTVLNIQVPPEWAGGITLRWVDIIVSFIGALLVLLITGFWRYRRL